MRLASKMPPRKSFLPHLSTFPKDKKMISKSKIEKKLKRKTNTELVKTIIITKKNKEWLKVSQLLSRPVRKMISVNLDEIDRETEEGDTVVVPGKVLSTGRIGKKIRVVAFSFSDSAEKKLKEKKCERGTIIEEVKKNPKAQGIKIIK